MTEHIALGWMSMQALLNEGVPVDCTPTGYYLPTDALLTGRQVSAAVKADPERLGARHEVYGEAGDVLTHIWTGSAWEYADGEVDVLHPDNFDTQTPGWYLVYRPKIEPQPQVFHSLAEFVTWAEHPDRLGQVSGIDADGDKVMVVQHEGCMGLFAPEHPGEGYSALRLPITAVEPTSKRQGKALRQWMVSHPGAKVRTECGRLPVWWDSDECDFFNDDGPAAVDDDVIGVPVSGNWND